MRLSFVIAAVLAMGVGALGCGGASGTVSGKVLVDGAPAPGQEVLLQGGRVLLTATTGADGAYQFKDVSEGAYLLSVDVASTLEHHLQAAVKAPATVPDLVFSGVASLSGTVSDAGKAPVAGAQVRLLGTQASGSTDAAGHFAFPAVPTGTHTLAVTSDLGSGQAEVTLALGEAKDVAVQVSAGPPATLTGQVGFFTRTDPSLIQVSVPAAGVTVQADSEGQYSLSVPPGEWDLFAQAPYYPSQKIGHVSAASGANVSVPARNLSLYTDLPDLGLAGALWTLTESRFGYLPRQAALLQYGAPDAPPAFYAFDLETHALRLISVGAEPVLSGDGHHAALPSSAGVLVIDLEAGTSFAVPTGDEVSVPTFSSDGKKLTFATVTPPRSFYSVDLAAGTWVKLPDFAEVDLRGERRLVQTTNVAPIIWKLVTPQGISTAFTNVPVVANANTSDLFGASSLAAYGLEACAAPPCLLDVLTADASAAVATDWAPATTDIDNKGSTGRWLLMSHAGTDLVLVDGASGTATPLPATANDGSFSPDGTRFLFRASGATTIFEHALPLPDPATLTARVTSTLPVKGGWISGSRYVGFDDAPTSGAAYRFTLDAGALTKDANYTASSGYQDELFAGWLGTDGMSHLILGVGTVHDAPEGQPNLPLMVMPEFQIQTTSSGVAFPAGERAFATWGDGKGWFFDGDAAPRSAPLLSNESWNFLFTGGLLYAPDVSDGLEFLDFDSGQRVQLYEPGRGELGFDFALGAPTSLVLTNRVSANGDLVGGGYAILPTFLLPI